MTACITCYISNKFLYSISLSTNSPDKGPLLETSKIEYFYLFQIVASENSSLGVVLLRRCLRWTSLVDDFFVRISSLKPQLFIFVAFFFFSIIADNCHFFDFSKTLLLRCSPRV